MCQSYRRRTVSELAGSFGQSAVRNASRTRAKSAPPHAAVSGCGIFSSRLKNPSALQRRNQHRNKRGSCFRPSPSVLVGVFLALYGCEHHVFRIAVLSVVLTVAIGPNAALLCRTRCDTHAAVASRCHDADPATSPTVAGDDSCSNVVLSLAAILRDEVGRGASNPFAHHAILVAEYRLAGSTTNARLDFAASRQRSLLNRPLAIALRL